MPYYILLDASLEHWISVHGLLNNTIDYDSIPLFFSSSNVTNKSGNPSMFISPYLILPKFYDERTGLTSFILCSLKNFCRF